MSENSSPDAPRPDAVRPGPQPEASQPAAPPSRPAQPTAQPQPQASGPRPPAYPGSFAPPQPPQQKGAFRRGFGLGAGAGLGFGGIMLVLGLIGSLLTSIMMAGAASAFAGANQTRLQPDKVIWGAQGAAHTLRAMRVSGAIMGEGDTGSLLQTSTYGYETAQAIDKLTASDADGLVLLFNTPGGTVNGSRAIADAIDRYKQRTGKKALVYVEGLSASGGMYAMAGADRIVADHGSLVGSIGIIMGPFLQYRDVRATTGTLVESGVTTNGGISSEYLTQGKGKDFGNAWRAMTQEERDNYTTGLANEYDNFVNWVARHRNIPAETIKNTYGAYMFDTKRAQENRLIDATMGRDEAFRDFATQAGVDPNGTKVVESEPPGMWAQLFGAEARVYGQAPAAKPEGGQPARATSTLCTSQRTPLAFSGSLASVCG